MPRVYNRPRMATRPIAVVALNGFMGDRRGHLDVGEIVNARAIMAGVAFYTKKRGGAEHGGWKPFAKRRLRKWILQKIMTNHKMVFVGKSYGAHWILDFYEEVSLVEFNSHALLFDPAHTLGRGENRVREVGGSHTITVVRQLGFRSGYQVKGARDVVVESDHKHIESRRPALLELHKFMDEHIPVEQS